MKCSQKPASSLVSDTTAMSLGGIPAECPLDSVAETSGKAFRMIAERSAACARHGSHPGLRTTKIKAPLSFVRLDTLTAAWVSKPGSATSLTSRGPIFETIPSPRQEAPLGPKRRRSIFLTSASSASCARKESQRRRRLV